MPVAESLKALMGLTFQSVFLSKQQNRFSMLNEEKEGLYIVF